MGLVGGLAIGLASGLAIASLTLDPAFSASIWLWRPLLFDCRHFSRSSNWLVFGNFALQSSSANAAVLKKKKQMNAIDLILTPLALSCAATMPHRASRETRYPSG